MDEGIENSFEQEQTPAIPSKMKTGEIFPSAILDSNDELTNLYKTISRKQILSKVQCASFNSRHQLNKKPELKVVSLLPIIGTLKMVYTTTVQSTISKWCHSQLLVP